MCAPQLLSGQPRRAPQRPPLRPTAGLVPGSPSPRSPGTPREWRSSGTLHPRTPLRSLGSGSPGLTCRLQGSPRPGSYRRAQVADALWRCQRQPGHLGCAIRTHADRTDSVRFSPLSLAALNPSSVSVCFSFLLSVSTSSS